MENNTYIALSRQITLRRQVDVVANNIANVNTPSFKSEGLTFREYVFRPKDEDKLSFVEEAGQVRNILPGPISGTGNSLDIALTQSGYFAVQTPQGERYTRHGRFQLDNTGQVVNSSGNPLMDINNQSIVIPPGQANIIISGDGMISTEQGQVAQLRVVNFDDEQDLLRSANNLYSTEQQPIAVTQPNVQQGFLEQSNVQAVKELVSMIEAQRSYQKLSSVINKDADRQLRALDRISDANR